MLPYRLNRRAASDLSAAREWYDRQSIDLGNEFIDAAMAAVRAARERPMSFPEVVEGARAVSCGKFPFRVYFEVVHKMVRVLAVYHTARDPSSWNDHNRQ
jgi:toxin ParE1/3/4